MLNELIIPCLGLLFILKYGYILQKPRNFLKDSCKLLNEFLSCCMCMGFWVGFFVSGIYVFMLGLMDVMMIFHCVMFGFMISFIGFFADVFLELLDAIIDFCNGKKNSDV